MNLEIQMCWRDFSKAFDKSMEWLILSWQKKDKYEREICRILYSKYEEERNKHIDRLCELTQKYYG